MPSRRTTCIYIYIYVVRPSYVYTDRLGRKNWGEGRKGGGGEEGCNLQFFPPDFIFLFKTLTLQVGTNVYQIQTNHFSLQRSIFLTDAKCHKCIISKESYLISSTFSNNGIIIVITLTTINQNKSVLKYLKRLLHQ